MNTQKRKYQKNEQTNQTYEYLNCYHHRNLIHADVLLVDISSEPFDLYRKSGRTYNENIAMVL